MFDLTLNRPMIGGSQSSGVKNRVADPVAQIASDDLADMGSIGHDEILAAVKRVTSHDIMRKSPKLQAFLNFIVSEYLAGRGHRLKAYSIGIAALGKHSAFDPTNDPIVRVEASRLRRSLSIYYATDGLNDPIRITIPSGSYQPVFERNQQIHFGDESINPLEVLPFATAEQGGVVLSSAKAVTAPTVNRARQKTVSETLLQQPRSIQNFILYTNLGIMLIMLVFGLKVLSDVQNLNARLDLFQKYWQQHMAAQVD